MDSSPEVSASLPLASAAAAASSWAMEVSLPTSLWGHELMTMTLWSGEPPKAVPWALAQSVLAQTLVPEPIDSCLFIWPVGLECQQKLQEES